VLLFLKVSPAEIGCTSEIFLAITSLALRWESSLKAHGKEYTVFLIKTVEGNWCVVEIWYPQN